MRSRLQGVMWVSVLVGMPLTLHAAPVRPTTLAELVGGSDVVVVGSVSEIRDLGPTTIAQEGRPLTPGRAFEARINARDWLKGSPASDSLLCLFAIPNLSNGYRGLQRVGTLVFFLRQRQGHYELASPFYPAIRVDSVKSFRERTAEENIVNGLGALLHSPDSSSDDKWEAVEWLSTSNTVSSRQVLRAILASTDPDLRLRGAAALLLMNDVTGLAIIERALLRRGLDVRPDSRRIALGALTKGVSSDAAVDSVAALLAADDVETRRSAAASLRAGRSRRAIQPLVHALGDADQDVQYSAVIGLAEVTGNTEAAPSVTLFKQNPTLYLNYWREWAKVAKL